MHSAGSYVVAKAADWALKQLQPKNHNLSFDDIKKLHTLFGPLLKVDPEAINCIAHLVNSNHSDPETDITLPVYQES
ncbi:MAG: hypothetical protein GY821_16245 [Gammaproteobacteria bacterium]|nr:hypothetical protein [Gammaproteobacteria bacterium]